MGIQERVEKISAWMNRQRIELLVFCDNETTRDAAVRYLSGHPFDALLFLHASGKSLLMPWDMPMARLYAQADYIIPYTSFKLDIFAALSGAIEHFGVKSGALIEIPDATAHPQYERFTQEFADYTLLCREDGGAGAFVRTMRSVKDAEEILVIKQAAAITDRLMIAIEKEVIAGQLKTESDAALFIESECRKDGCEGVSFATLAAGAPRSFGIHAFPPYTNGAFAGKGLSLLDFGVVYKGYASDVTMTFARGPLCAAQEKQLKLIAEAFGLALSILNGQTPLEEDAGGQEGISARHLAKAVDSLFAAEDFSMPHGLGHGIGLQVHEKPYIRSRETNTDRLLPGMTFTIEPGLYSAEAGGCRWENDILLHASGAEVLTHSKIVLL